jgi:hypothetical protein
LGQHQKRGLAGIFGILDMAEHAPANPEHQAAMAQEQRLERRLIMLDSKALEQLMVGLLSGPADEMPKVLYDRMEWTAGHAAGSPNRLVHLL